MAGKSDEDKELKGPYTYLFALVLLTLIYISIMTWLQSDPFEGVGFLLKNLTIGIYFLLVYFSMYTINRDNYAVLCETNKPKSMVAETLVPFLLVFMPVYFIINHMFIGWKKPFADTIGYFVISMFGYKKLFIELFKDKIGPSESTTSDNNSAKQKLQTRIDRNIHSILANTVNIGNLSTWLSPLKDGDEKSDPLKKKFKMLVHLKYYISEFIWLTLAGLVMIMMMIVSVEDADKCVTGSLVD